jgi:leucyl aminopeptidase (aminopeptidase T)
MPLRRIALLLIVVIAAGCGGPMRADELSRSVETLASAAAEGALLADGAARDRTKATFTRAHARELGETVEHEAEKLSDATAHGAVAGDKADAVELADRISQQLSQLQTAPDDRAGARRAQAALRALADAATRLADGAGS